MADDVTLNPGSNGSIIAADNIDDVFYQRVKIITGADGTNSGDVSSTVPLPIVAAGNSRDGITNALVGIDYGHHEIHEGNMYEVDVFIDTGAAATVSCSFKIPSGTKRVHMRWWWYAESAAHFEVIEGMTWTATTGTEVAIFNSNRNSTNTSIIQDDKAEPFAADMKVLQDVTGKAGGTTIHTHYDWADKKVGTKSRDEGERILKNDSTYVFRVVSDDGNKGQGMRLQWYEHTDVA